MLNRIIYISILIATILPAIPAWSQEEGALRPEEIVSYKNQVTQLMRFLEGTVNFMGDPENPFKEKEIIINESYSKIFLNDKVQIEDDLDDNREYSIYKDVQAYLKDIDFFYKQVQFTFEITGITHFVNGQGQHYFLVTLIRRMKGVTIKNDTVDSQKTRYIEVNLDLARDDFKIASIYTNKFNEKEEVRKWWNDLEPAWRDYFGKDRYIADSILMSDILFFQDSIIALRWSLKSANEDAGTGGLFTEIAQDTVLIDTISFDTRLVYSAVGSILKSTEVDVSGLLTIRNLNPLGELSDLRHLNISNTLVNDLLPLRNLNKLETLDCHGIPVRDLTPLQYSTLLHELNFGNTLITSINPVSNLYRLERINCSGNRIGSFTSLENLPELRQLECDSIEIYNLDDFKSLRNLEVLSISNTYVSDLSPLSDLEGIRRLNCDNTLVTSLEPLAKFENLEYLFINNTGVRSLSPLNGLSSLKRIYCNNTLVTGTDAIQFMRENKGCLVVYESEELKKAWMEMDEVWKDIFSEQLGLSGTPSEEELHGLLRIEELNLSGRKDITDLTPLRKLYNLKKLNVSYTGALDFSPLMELFKLEYLNLSGTSVKTLDNLVLLNELQSLLIDSTAVSLLEPLYNLNIKYIYADNTGVDDKEAFDFAEQSPGCLVIYKTTQLNKWWINLPETWKDFFMETYSMNEMPSTEELHRLLYAEKIGVSGNRGINDLKPLLMLRGLKEISLAGIQVSDIKPLSSFRNLSKLELNQCPVSDLEPLKDIRTLTHLSLQNTPVKDLKPLALLGNLTYLNFSGTSVSNLKPVEGMTELRVIEFSNTSIKNIKSLNNCKMLEKVVCFNTRVSSSAIDKFREQNPDCEVVYY